VVVVRRDATDPLSNQVRNKLTGELSDVKTLRELGDHVEDNFDDVEVTFKRFEEIGD
jgi:hypothetical protein